MFWGSVGPWAWLGWLGWLGDPKNPKLRGGSGQVKKLHSCDVHFEALGQIWAGTHNRGLGPQASWGVLGASRGVWGVLGRPGASWGVLGCPGASCGVLGRLGAFGASWGGQDSRSSTWGGGPRWYIFLG